VPQTGTGQPPARHQNGLKTDKNPEYQLQLPPREIPSTAQFSEGSHPKHMWLFSGNLVAPAPPPPCCIGASRYSLSSRAGTWV
jgi:hypothetical protein